MFNILSKRPKVAGRCDDDGAPLIMRKDDREDVIRERLRTYREVTRPVLDSLPQRPLFPDLRETAPLAYIFEEITRILESVIARHAKA